MTDGGGSNRQFRKPPKLRKPKGFSDEAVLSDDEVLRRVDLRETRRRKPDPADEDRPDPALAALLSPWIGEASSQPLPAELTAAPAAATQRVEAVRSGRAAADDRRRQLWRDSATILIGVVLALLVGQTLLPAQVASPDGSPTPLPSTIAIGSVAPPVSLAPGATFGPIINPSLGIDATPTPIPVITMGPTPSPSPSPSIEPSASVRPSVKPTVKPTAKPTPKPTPRPTPRPTRTPSPATPPPTPIPPPTVSLNCATQLASLTITCTSSSTNIQSDSQRWNMGGAGSFGSGGDTFASAEYTYDEPGIYTVELTVTGDNGSTTSAQETVTVPGL